MKFLILPLAFILLLVLSAILKAKPKVDLEYIFERITHHANKNSLEVALVKAVAKQESRFNPLAKNLADPSYGLMQVTPILAQDFGYVKNYEAPTVAEIASLYNIDNNLDIACKFLKRLSKYPFDRMIQSYNVGEYGYTIGHRNKEYLKKVRGYYDSY